MHSVTPAPQAPIPSQGSPTTKPSSVVPSQSLSRPSQISSDDLSSVPPGAVEHVRLTESGTHSVRPLPHTPTASQSSPSAKSSSVRPSQSLSRVSQTSSDGAPGVQESTPEAQRPMDAHSPRPHATGKPSVTPSQSLSRPSQISNSD